jgi:hypothetical protein
VAGDVAAPTVDSRAALAHRAMSVRFAGYSEMALGSAVVSIFTGVDDRFGKGLRSFSRQLVPNAAVVLVFPEKITENFEKALRITGNGATRSARATGQHPRT